MTFVVEVSDLFFVDNVAVSCLKSKACSVLNKSKALETDCFAGICCKVALVLNILKSVEVSKTCSLKSYVSFFLGKSNFLNLTEKVNGNVYNAKVNSYVDSSVIVSILTIIKKILSGRFLYR